MKRRCRDLHVLTLFATLSGLALAADVQPAKEASPAVPPPEKILATLRTGHPRIMADLATFEAIKESVAHGGLPAKIYGEVKRKADKTLVEKVSIYEKPDGKRLLTVSRRVRNRVAELALVSRLENDPRYAVRAWQELEAAARFPDWNPAHFLDTAEMTHAFALGYDWLYDQWSDEQRRVLRTAIVEKGLKEGLKVYASKKGWPRNENNWNQVCNGGLISGALAIADVEPQVAAQIVSKAAQSVPLAMRHYEPDGAGTEGVTYWGYASHYNIVLLASLQFALGTDFGLSRVGAFDKSGYYPMYMCGQGRYSFDFADCSVVRISEPQHFWLARHYNSRLWRWLISDKPISRTRRARCAPSPCKIGSACWSRMRSTLQNPPSCGGFCTPQRRSRSATAIARPRSPRKASFLRPGYWSPRTARSW